MAGVINQPPPTIIMGLPVMTLPTGTGTIVADGPGTPPYVYNPPAPVHITATNATPSPYQSIVADLPPNPYVLGPRLPLNSDYQYLYRNGRWTRVRKVKKASRPKVAWVAGMHI